MNAPQKTIVDDLSEGRELAIDPSAISTIVRGEIDMQIATAHRYPRSVAVFRKEALGLVTLSEAVAEGCNYVLRRRQYDKEKREWVTVNIEGPSARFAEVICSTWGNVRWGSRVVGEREGFIVAQGMFHDLQHNSAGAVEVERSILTSQGERFKQDMIGVTANAAGSIALRNAILKGIPRAFWNDIYLEARKVALGDFKTLTNRRIDALDACKNFGVSPEQVFALLGVKGIDDIGLEHLLTLKGILTAIREGETTPESTFPSEQAAAEILGKPAHNAMPKAKSDAKSDNPRDNPPGDPPEAAHDAAKATPAPAGAPASGPAVAMPEGDRAPSANAKQAEPDPFSDMRSEPPFDTGTPALFADSPPPPTGFAPAPMPPAHKPGTFMATPGEARSIVTRARARKVSLQEVLMRLPEKELPGVRVEGEGEDARIVGLTKEGYMLLKAELS